MADSTLNELAKPVHIQRLEKSLRLDSFLDHVQHIFSREHRNGDTSSESDDDVCNSVNNSSGDIQYMHGLSISKADRITEKCKVYNFEKLGEERAWLRDVLLSDSSSSESNGETSKEEEVKELLFLHQLKKKYQAKFHENSKNRQYMYYSAGLLSKNDIYPEHKMLVLNEEDGKVVRERRDKGRSAPKRKKKVKSEEKEVPDAKLLSIKSESSTALSSLGIPASAADGKDSTEGISCTPVKIATVKKEPMEMADRSDFNLDSDVDESEGLGLFENMTETGSGMQSPSQNSGASLPPLSPSPHLYPQEQKKKKKRNEKRGDDKEDKKLKKEKGERKSRSKKEKGPPSVKALIAQRRKLWLVISKKEISKAAKARINNHKEQLASCKRAATGCMRVCRLRAMQSQKAMKEIVWRAKRLTREMQSYWKRYDRVEKVQRRQAEKEAEEQRKLDVELMEARRQQRKLNFLITQTELYAHFMAKKLGHADAVGEQERLILSHLEEEANPQLAYLDDYDSDLIKQRAMNNVNTAFHAHEQRTQQFDSQVTHEAPQSLEPQARPEYAQPKLFHGSLKSYQLKGMNWISNLYDEGINGILADEMGLGKTVQSIAFLAHIAERYGIWGPFLVISPASTLHNWQQELARFVPDFKVIPYWGNPQERKILRKFWDTRNLHTPEASFHVVVTSYQLIVTDFKYFNRIKWQYMVLDEAQAIKSSSSTRWKMLLTFNCRNRLLLSGTPIQNSMAELWALLHFIMPTLFDSHEEFNEWFSKDIESHAENKTGIDEKHLSRLHMILKPFMLRRVKKDVENELSDKIEIMMYCPLTNRQRMLYQALKRKISIDDLLYSGSSSASAQSATTTLMNLVMQFRKVCNHPELFERREAKSPYHFTPDPQVLPKFIYRHGLLREAFPSQGHLLFGRFYIWHPEYVHHSLFPPESTDSSHTLHSNSFASFSRLMALSPLDLFKFMNQGTLASLTYNKQLIEEEHVAYHNFTWGHLTNRRRLLISCQSVCSVPSLKSSRALEGLVFTSTVGTGYAHLDHQLHSMPETIEHRILRSRKAKTTDLPEFPFQSRPVQIVSNQWSDAPNLLSLSTMKVSCRGCSIVCSDRSAAYWLEGLNRCGSIEGENLISYGSIVGRPVGSNAPIFQPIGLGGIEAAKPKQGWSNVVLPDKETLICDAGKLQVLDTLLRRLKSEGHRVLIYSQMTRIIDLLEEYMWHRKWSYMRLDGSSKISERRDMVADFQTRSDIFVFLLSTRAGGLGINLTAADTVIFYDSDWNPTVDQQAMDRAHRLGQTKQVTVYRLICKGTIEERILQRAREKSKIQKIVISGGSFKPDTLKPTEVVSLLLDDEEIERKYRQRQAERKQQEIEREAERKRKYLGGSAGSGTSSVPEAKRPCLSAGTPTEYTPAASPTLTEQSSQSGFRLDETSNDGSLVVDDTGPMDSSGVGRFTPLIPGRQRPRPGRGGGRRGRPPGGGRRARSGRDQVPKGSAESELGFMSPTEANISLDLSVDDEEAGSPQGEDVSPSNVVKRRPGRPRLRPVGPAHQGGRQPKRSIDGGPSVAKRGRRGAPSGPRVIKPLPVPIGSMTTNKPSDARASSSSSPFAPSSSTSSTNPKPFAPGFYGPVSP